MSLRLKNKNFRRYLNNLEDSKPWDIIFWLWNHYCTASNFGPVCSLEIWSQHEFCARDNHVLPVQDHSQSFSVHEIFMHSKLDWKSSQASTCGKTIQCFLPFPYTSCLESHPPQSSILYYSLHNCIPPHLNIWMQIIVSKIPGAGRSLEVLFIITMWSAVPFINTKVTSHPSWHFPSHSIQAGAATMSVVFLSVMHYQHSFSPAAFCINSLCLSGK